MELTTLPNEVLHRILCTLPARYINVLRLASKRIRARCQPIIAAMSKASLIGCRAKYHQFLFELLTGEPSAQLMQWVGTPFAATSATHCRGNFGTIVERIQLRPVWFRAFILAAKAGSVAAFQPFQNEFTILHGPAQHIARIAMRRGCVELTAFLRSTLRAKGIAVECREWHKRGAVNFMQRVTELENTFPQPTCSIYGLSGIISMKSVY